MAFQESLQNTLRGPTFIGISIGGGIIAAFAAAGVVSVSLSKIILLCVWGVLVAEVSFAKWFNRAKGYRYSLLLFIVLVSGIGDVYLGAVIANMKYKQDEAARLHPKSENTPSPDTATKTHRTPDGFLQFSQIVLNKNYSQIVPGKVLGMNMGFVGKVKPVHNAYTFMKLAVVDVTPTGQAQFLKTARDMTKKEYGGALKQWKNGKDIGIDEVLWDTIKVGPLDEETATRLLEGQSLVYVYRWAKWKDPAESVGTIEACRWLQWPQSNQLRQEDM